MKRYKQFSLFWFNAFCSEAAQLFELIFSVYSTTGQSVSFLSLCSVCLALFSWALFSRLMEGVFCGIPSDSIDMKRVTSPLSLSLCVGV